jgi:hypothetical protein
MNEQTDGDHHERLAIATVIVFDTGKLARVVELHQSGVTDCDVWSEPVKVAEIDASRPEHARRDFASRIRRYLRQVGARRELRAVASVEVAGGRRRLELGRLAAAYYVELERHAPIECVDRKQAEYRFRQHLGRLLGGAPR